MRNVVICDHRTPDELTSLREGLENFGHTVVVSTHENHLTVYDDIVNMCTNPTEEKPRPDVVLTDLAYEPDELPISVDQWWGCRLICLLQQNPVTNHLRIITRTRYPNAPLAQYLTGIGINQEDITDHYTTNIRKIAEMIGDC
jgi:CheY-like chemotaxis protein